MQNRLFLLTLLSILLLVQAVLRSATQATPFSGGDTLGGIPFWELRGAIPLGIFAAGMFLVAAAAAILCLQTALQLWKGAPQKNNQAHTLVSALLWCGAPAMAICYNALPHIFSWLQAYDPSGWQTRQHLEWVLHGGLALLVLCHVLAQFKRTAFAWFILPASLLFLLALGQIGFNHALLLIPTATISAFGFLLIMRRHCIGATILLLITGLIHFVLLWCQASTAATIPAAALTYIATLLALAAPFYLKTAAPKA